MKVRSSNARSHDMPSLAIRSWDASGPNRWDRWVTENGRKLLGDSLHSFAPVFPTRGIPHAFCCNKIRMKLDKLLHQSPQTTVSGKAENMSICFINSLILILRDLHPIETTGEGESGWRRAQLDGNLISQIFLFKDEPFFSIFLETWCCMEQGSIKICRFN